MTTTTYSNCNMFDGTKDTLTDNAWFTVDASTGRITATGTGTAPTTSDNTVDFHGKYVMPGLMNAHTHITSEPNSGSLDSKDTEAAATVRAINALHALLKSGVTYIRECGTGYDIDLTLVHEPRTGAMAHTPEMMPSGMAYSMTGGHGDSKHFGHRVDSPDEMRKKVRKGMKKGAMNIKVMATGGVMTPDDFMDDAQLNVDEMHVAVEEAHKRGRTVAAHAEGNPGIMNAIKAGVDSVEHCFYVTDEEADMMIKQNTYLVATMVADWAIPEYGPGKLPDWEVKKAADALDDLYHNIRRAWQRGVKVALGTDAGTPFNDFSMTPKELELMVQQGATPFEALRTSYNSAELMHLTQDYATLETGKFADFLVLDGNPLADVTAVQQEDKQVYKFGKREF
ncbi:metal-dependent hydrolase family protein [Lacticaseibacillus zhaodongensis]|uniref:metal-dependent hydrolase family protein n=1 Tax=Lacticaseibacillus zhaodongensis TaxID=2668065 RepID=UPI0012D36F62|nr:amidohydrolase family protein [Lacticaseibacillus zhaodongensis]